MVSAFAGHEERSHTSNPSDVGVVMLQFSVQQFVERMFKMRFHRFLFYLFLSTVMGWIIFSVYYRNKMTNSGLRTQSTNTISHLVPSPPRIQTRVNDHQIISQTPSISLSLPSLTQQHSYSTNQSHHLSKIHTLSDDDDDDDHLHLIFSTDCSPFQDWQTLLLFHSAEIVQQKGIITRIASGCSNEKKQKLQELYQTLHPKYSIHVTPDFSIDQKTQKKYEFYNKPYGLLHWLENVQPPLSKNTIIALLDPDFVFIRPLTTRILHEQNLLFSPLVTSNDLFDKVRKGQPVAQHYGLGANWAINSNQKKSLNRTKICGENSPCLQVPNPDIGSKYYSVGAPYLLDKDDMMAVAKSWVEFVPKVYEDYPDLLAEMFAYSMAAAHQNLPHLRLDHFMVSNINAEGEGWDFIDQLQDRVTEPPIHGIYFPNHSLPVFVHYCQFFRSAEYGFHKRRVYGDLFSCYRPMLLDLPSDGRLAKVNYKDRDGEVRLSLSLSLSLSTTL
jgi:peptidyl serine alpha-galactosyltransferase